MIKLSDREWEAFYVRDIFKPPSRPKPRSEKQYVSGCVPFVASGNINNGVIRCCHPHDGEVLDKGNCLTVSPVDGSSFYHGYDFLGRGGAGSSIIILRREGLNRHVGLFISRALRHTCSKYCYGKMGSQDSIEREKVLLPVNAQGEPDYAFMEAYVKEREKALLKRYSAFMQSRASLLQGRGGNLCETRWRAFRIGKIFDMLVPGKSKGHNHLVHDRQGTSYIGATNRNNGVLDFVKPDNTLQNGNCIGFIKNGNGLGSAGHAIYKAESFISTSDVIYGYAQWVNRYTGLFFVACSDMNAVKFSHGYKWTPERIKRSFVMLPATQQDKPDLAFMEDFGREIMHERLERYLAYRTEKTGL